MSLIYNNIKDVTGTLTFECTNLWGRESQGTPPKKLPGWVGLFPFSRERADD